MTKTFCSVLALFVVAVMELGTARAQSVSRLEITEYGIYAATKTNCHRDAEGIERCDRSSMRHAASTWTIPADIGVEFGLRYRVIGTPPQAKLNIKRVWLLPDPGFRPPNRPAIHMIERTDSVTIGDPLLISYGFDDPWELVPGPWRVQFFYGERLLGERTFTIVKN